MPYKILLNLLHIHPPVKGTDSPHRQSLCRLLWKLRWVHEHQSEEELQVANVSRQSGTEGPGPVPTLSFPPSTKVNDN